MATGLLLTRATAIVAVGLFTLALALRSRARSSADPERTRVQARVAWSVGCAIFIVHVACAFHFVHSWSHAAAYETTARETFELTGWNFGAGLWANYLFTAVWIVDVIWWWRGTDRYEARPKWINGAILGFLGFIAFNATVVFGGSVARGVGVGACAVLIAAAFAQKRPS